MQVLGGKLVWDGGSLTRLLDGVVSFGRDFFPDPRGAEIPEAVDLPVQAYLLQRDGAAPVLIDTGSGQLYGEKGGGVLAALSAEGVTPPEVAAVLMTHMHGDHCGGLLDPGFQNAVVCVSQQELDYWPSQDHPSARFIAQNASRIQTFANLDHLAPGVTAWQLSGHTPGHSGFVIDDRVAVIGDVVHRADIQLADPLIATKFDVNRLVATETRLSALAEITDRGMVCCGGHFQLPGTQVPFLRLSAHGAGYKAHSV